MPLVEPIAYDDRSRNEAKLLTLNLLLRRALLDVPADSVVAHALVCAEEFNVEVEAWEDSVDTARDVAAIEVVTGYEADEVEDEAEVKEENVGGGEDEDGGDEEGEGEDEGDVEVQVEEEADAEKDEWADDLRWSMKACLAFRSKAEVWM
ncbi:hypothetical protein BGZ75_002482 [Mortierella antarctica]|nr:hypothetical protein BGZ75_002482 [Mortierella antarctica]